MNLAKLPAYQAKLLGIVAEIAASLAPLPSIRFYMTGGAGVEYSLPPAERKAILDIDCVCVADPALSRADHDAVREESMTITAAILKKHLEGASWGDLLADTPSLPIVKIGFNSDLGGMADGPAIAIPNSSPLTGMYYYDKKRKLFMMSVRLRTGVVHRELQSLLDISFPTYEFPRLAAKWAESERIRQLRVTPTSTSGSSSFTIPTLFPEFLVADQKYAAASAAAANTAAAATNRNRNRTKHKINRRLNRVARLSARVPALPVVKARIVTPAAPPPRAAAPPPPVAHRVLRGKPTITIRMVGPGAISLFDHRSGEEWPAVAYDPYSRLYRFGNGMEGRVGDTMF